MLDWSRRERWTLAWIFLAGLLLRAGVASLLVVLSNDGSSLIQHAASVADGDWQVALDHTQHPLTSMTLAIPMRLGVPPLPAARFTLLLLSALCLIPVWLLARDTSGVRIGVLVAIMAAAHGHWLWQSAVVLTEPLYLLCLATCAAAGWRAVRNGNTGAHSVFALSGSLAFLTRPEGLILPTVVAVFLAERLLYDVEHRRRRVAGSVVGLVIALLLIGPYVGYISAREGSFTLSAKKISRDKPGLSSAERAAIERIAASPEPENSAPPTSEKTILRLLSEYRDKLGVGFSAPMLILASLGVLGLLGRACFKGGRPESGWRPHLYLAGILLGYSTVYLWHLSTQGYISSRQVSSIAFLVMPWAALAMQGIVSFAGPERSSRNTLLLTVLLAVVVSFGLYKGVRRHGEDKSQLLHAARYLQDRPDLQGRMGAPGRPPSNSPVIMGTLPRVAFYAGAAAVRPPGYEPWYRDEEWRAILKESFLDAPGADFFVIDRSRRKRYAPLLDHLEGMKLTLAAEFPAREELGHADDVLVFEIGR